MRKKVKIGVAFAMSLGIFAGAAAIVKTTYLVKLPESADFTWEMVRLLNWAAVEDGLTIIASSIPTLKPLLTKIFPTSTAQESYNMPPPRANYEKKKQLDHTTEARDNSSQQSILPTTRDNKINMTTDISVSYRIRRVTGGVEL
ncbi:hypothetical protein BDW59DRAFT_41117 [Aspergillus cavernicola]|uniref:Rhodopsin domain-containing protein n=1 Tax=Aspergillus cavernicola TaxID=176166 RepID=A0ABR4IMM9_9EURO